MTASADFILGQKQYEEGRQAGRVEGEDAAYEAIWEALCHFDEHRPHCDCRPCTVLRPAYTLGYGHRQVDHVDALMSEPEKKTRKRAG